MPLTNRLCRLQHFCANMVMDLCVLMSAFLVVAAIFDCTLRILVAAPGCVVVACCVDLICHFILGEFGETGVCCVFCLYWYCSMDDVTALLFSCSESEYAQRVLVANYHFCCCVVLRTLGFFSGQVFDLRVLCA